MMADDAIDAATLLMSFDTNTCLLSFTSFLMFIDITPLLIRLFDADAFLYYWRHHLLFLIRHTILPSDFAARLMPLFDAIPL